MARSYPVRTVIQLSIEVVPLLSSLGTFFAIHNPLIWSQQFEKAQANRKSRFTQHLAERIEIPFRSKKLCKSALLQSRSLFVRRPVNRLKTGGRRRRLVAAEALAATQAHRSPWHKPRKSLLLGYLIVCSPVGSMGIIPRMRKMSRQNESLNQNDHN